MKFLLPALKLLAEGTLDVIEVLQLIDSIHGSASACAAVNLPNHITNEPMTNPPPSPAAVAGALNKLRAVDTYLKTLPPLLTLTVALIVELKDKIKGPNDDKEALKRRIAELEGQLTTANEGLSAFTGLADVLGGSAAAADTADDGIAKATADDALSDAFALALGNYNETAASPATGVTLNSETLEDLREAGLVIESTASEPVTILGLVVTVNDTVAPGNYSFTSGAAEPPPPGDTPPPVEGGGDIGTGSGGTGEGGTGGNDTPADPPTGGTGGTGGAEGGTTGGGTGNGDTPAAPGETTPAAGSTGEGGGTEGTGTGTA